MLLCYIARLAGVGLLMLLLVGCAGEAPTSAANAPASLIGAWSSTDGGQTFYIIFLENGEFRAGGDFDTLFDNPAVLGRYQYQDGLLSLTNAHVTDNACRLTGHYVLVEYQPGAQATIRLRKSQDACANRLNLFDDALWVQVATEG